MRPRIDVDKARQILRNPAVTGEFSGTILIAQADDVLIEESFGIASRRWQISASNETRFDIASVTKLFTSVAVLQQVELGRLSLESTIGQFVDLAGTRIDPNITIGHVLSHTSGIGDDADEEAGESYEALWVDRPTYSVMRTSDFLPQFVFKEPNFAPGEGCRYCNCGYILAGLALESVSGMDFRAYIQEHVFARAGMADAGFFDMRDAEPRVAEGWEPQRDGAGAVTSWKQNIFSYPPIGSPDAGAHSTAADLARFFSAVRNHRLLSPELTAELLTPRVKHRDLDSGGEIHFGLGLEFELGADGDVEVIYKEGINVGASAFLAYFPAADATLVLVSNSQSGVWEPFAQLREAIPRR